MREIRTYGSVRAEGTCLARCPSATRFMSEMSNKLCDSLQKSNAEALKGPRFDPFHQEIFQFGNLRGLPLDGEIVLRESPGKGHHHPVSP